MLRFFLASMTAAIIVLVGDRYANQFFLALGSQFAANYAYKLFVWMCMSAAVTYGAPARRHWRTILVCALALTVAIVEGRMIALLTLAQGAQLLAGWAATLLIFALPAWLIGMWYNDLPIEGGR